MFSRKFLRVGWDFWLVVFLFLSFSFVYSLLAVVRHNHFQSQAIDFSIYDQALWLWSHFERPFSTITFHHDLADRFRPIMILLSVIYWFTENERAILILQAVAFCAAAFPIWLVARRRLAKILAMAIVFAFLNFVGIASATVYEFHEMAFLPVFLSWMFYFLEKEKWRSYFVFLILALAVREIVGFLVATLSIFIYFEKKNVKIAVWTFLISIIWSFAAISVIMPRLGQDQYHSFVKTGDTLGGAILSYLERPWLILAYFLAPAGKLSTLFLSFFSFGLIPLLYWPLAPAILLQFASRFLDVGHPIRWTLYYHYGVDLAVLLAFSTIYSGERFAVRWRSILATMIVGASLLSFAFLHHPGKLILRPSFWQSEDWMRDTSQILSLVPRDVSVASQNNLVPHLSHRKEVYVLPFARGAKYLMFDLHMGQNDWNFYNQNLVKAREEFIDLVGSRRYKISASAGDVFLLEKL